MDNPTNENLKDLLAGFMDEGAASQAKEDIEKGDEILGAYPAPQPSDAVLAEVTNKVVAAVRRRHSIALRRRVWATAGIAAAIVIVSVAAMKLFEKQPTGRAATQYASAISAKIWESSDIAADDPNVAALTAEVETIENELSKVRLNETVSNGSGAVGDLEMELIEIGSEFWKG